MPWNSPVNPTPGSVITAAFAIANWLDPIRWLRLMTGNADPPGTAYVVVSSSATATSWAKVPTDALADGAVTAAKMASGAALGNLPYTPVNKAGDAMLGPLQVRQHLTLESSGGVAGDITQYDTNGITYWLLSPVAGTGDYAIVRSGTGGGLYMNDGAGPNANVLAWLGSRVWTAADAPTFTGALAALSGAFTNALTAASATISGAVSAVSATISTTLGVTGNTTIGGSLGVTGTIASNSTVQGTRLIATVATGTPPLQVSSTTLVTSLNGQYLQGFTPSATPAPAVIPVADATGKLDSGWLPASGIAGVPSNLIAAVAVAAQIPTGWTRYATLDGLIPIGAGTTFGVAFTENTSYGSSWSHAHADGGVHNHGSGGLFTSGTTDNNDGSNSAQLNPATPGFVASPGPHKHGLSSVPIGGNTANNGPVATSSDRWIIPVRAVVWVIKT